MHNSKRDVVVIGGGITGLAAAHRLTEAGASVTLLESSGQLGGLGTFFPMGERWVERFYHCIMPSDDHLLGLLDRLGLREEVDWRRTSMGMVFGEDRYPFNSALDLLRFTPLTLLQRLRFGVVSLLLRHLGRHRDLDRTRTEDWLRDLYGDVIWEKLFVPMFGSKFGAAFADVPALYLWQRLGRESNVATRGYPAGGYKSIIDALHASIEANGGRIHLSTPVGSIAGDEDSMRVTVAGGEVIDCDRVLSTVPLPQLRRLAEPELAERLPATQLAYQGVVNALFFLRRPLEGHYWTPVLHSAAEFDGVVEMTELTGEAAYDGRYLAYAMRYTDRGSALFADDEAAIAERWTGQLLRLYAGLPLTREDIAEVRVFKAPFVEPVYPLGYLTRRPPVAVPGTRLLLATTAHVYPDVTSWNSSVGLADSVAGLALATRGAARTPNEV
ncbi:FAD-dependent oxidoreductase [Amycolatopsis magusensis]|uniref:FAD-dependent oxidoreductase n=1 Tax=Amycolatopsis magusensis TaxID=882444 RepID=UPI0024A95631|nr:FAD-dependent oxidoreductase [Amycolatopsis magusensis]MDI5982230.1 FAD-dependent oxidoreductase [Amycolatopsis magusensis]